MKKIIKEPQVPDHNLIIQPNEAIMEATAEHVGQIRLATPAEFDKFDKAIVDEFAGLRKNLNPKSWPYKTGQPGGLRLSWTGPHQDPEARYLISKAFMVVTFVASSS